jgi:hypothetical protein
MRPPFAIAAIEDQDAVVRAHAEHIDEIVDLPWIELDEHARAQAGAEKETLGVGVKARH